MAWFCNYYICARCGFKWIDEWSCMCEDDCPNCDFRHMTPVSSDDLTYIIEEQKGGFALLHSPDMAEHFPDYLEIATFPTREEARRYQNSVSPGGAVAPGPGQ
jgi:hypothetical protein